MATGYNAKGNLQFQRQLEVQRMSIPFVIVGNASSASVSASTDEPGIMFLQTQGTNNISANVPAGETATYASSPTDSTGSFNVLVVVTEPLNKLVDVSCKDRVTGTAYTAFLGSSLSNGAGISLPASGNLYGTALMVTVNSGVALNSSSNTINGVLEIEYIVYENQGF